MDWVGEVSKWIVKGESQYIIKRESRNGLYCRSPKMNHNEGVPKGIFRKEPQNGLLRGSPKMDCKGESQNGLYKGSPKMDFTGDVMFKNGLKTGIK